MRPSGESRPILIAVSIALIILIFFAISVATAFFAARFSTQITDIPLPSQRPVEAAQTTQTAQTQATGEATAQTETMSPVEASTTATAPGAETAPETPTATPRVAVIAPPVQETPDGAAPATAATEQASAGTAPLLFDVAYTPYIEDAFDSPDRGWPVRSTPTSSTAYITGTYQLALYGQAAIVVSTPLDADTYRIRADVMVEDGTGGLIFLGAQPSIHYRLLISTNGTYAVQEQQGTDKVTNIVAWTESSALRRGANVVNQLQIERRNNQIAVSANDQLLTLIELETAEAAGQFGFVLAAETGQGNATFDNLVVERGSVQQ